jgi:hypothetical protein
MASNPDHASPSVAPGRRPWRFLYRLALVLAFAPALVGVVMAWSAWHHHSVIASSGAPAVALVRAVQASPGGKDERLLLDFSAQGHEVLAWCDAASGRYVVGSKVTLRYDAKDPKRVAFQGDDVFKQWPIELGGALVCATVFMVGSLVAMRVRAWYRAFTRRTATAPDGPAAVEGWRGVRTVAVATAVLTVPVAIGVVMLIHRTEPSHRLDSSGTQAQAVVEDVFRGAEVGPRRARPWVRLTFRAGKRAVTEKVFMRNTGTLYPSETVGIRYDPSDPAKVSLPGVDRLGTGLGLLVPWLLVMLPGGLIFAIVLVLLQQAAESGARLLVT